MRLVGSIGVDHQERTLAEGAGEERDAGPVRRPGAERVPRHGLGEEGEIRAIGPHQRESAVSVGVGMEDDPLPVLDAAGLTVSMRSTAGFHRSRPGRG